MREGGSRIPRDGIPCDDRSIAECCRDPPPGIGRHCVPGDGGIRATDTGVGIQHDSAIQIVVNIVVSDGVVVGFYEPDAAIVVSAATVTVDIAEFEQGTRSNISDITLLDAASSVAEYLAVGNVDTSDGNRSIRLNINATLRIGSGRVAKGAAGNKECVASGDRKPLATVMVGDAVCDGDIRTRIANIDSVAPALTYVHPGHRGG